MDELKSIELDKQNTDELKPVDSIFHKLLVFVTSIFLGFGFLLEDPFVRRGGLILALSIIFVVLLIVLHFIRKNKYLIHLVLVGLTVDIIALEFYSKFAMNYLYHVLYFVIVLAVVLYCDRWPGVYMAIGVVLASFIKFMQLIYIEPTQNNIANFTFYSVVQILLITMVFIAKEYYIQSRKTKQLYGELLDAYQQLNDYSRDIEVLSAKEERSSIARDLHDTLGHDLTGLIMQLELAKHNMETDEELGKRFLTESIDNARGSLTKVRAIVDTLKNQEKLVFVNRSLSELTESFEKRTGIQVKLKVVNEEAIRPDYLNIIYWIIQEALTNVAKHSESKNVKVLVKHDKKGTIIIVSDTVKKFYNSFKKEKNIEIVKGNGLIGMEERLESVHGTISFSKRLGSESGFEIKGFIPKEVDKDD